jgi:hypothetical protein
MGEPDSTQRYVSARDEFNSGILKDYRRGRTEFDLEQMSDVGIRARKAKFQKLLDADAEFYILYRCTNISASWLSLLAGALVEDIADIEVDRKPSNEQVAALAFFSRLANDLWAIIELTEAGFDLQARALTRGYLEHVDVLICCIHDREITDEFVDAIEPEEANAFWHKHVSKNKAKAKVTRLIGEALGIGDTDLVDRLREDADSAGSSLIHPTMLAGLSTAFGTENGDYETFPIFPTPVAESVGIFRSILIHLMWLWFAMGTLPKLKYGDWDALFHSKHLLDNEFIDDHSRIYSRVIGFLLDNQLLMVVNDPDTDTV